MTVWELEDVDGRDDEANSCEVEVGIEGSDHLILLAGVNDLEALAKVACPDKYQIEGVSRQG